MWSWKCWENLYMCRLIFHATFVHDDLIFSLQLSSTYHPNKYATWYSLVEWREQRTVAVWIDHQLGDSDRGASLIEVHQIPGVGGRRCEADYSTELITLEVGSRGVIRYDDFVKLQSIFSTSRKLKATDCLILAVIRTTLLESYKIWCSRNTVYWVACSYK